MPMHIFLKIMNIRLISTKNGSINHMLRIDYFYNSFYGGWHEKSNCNVRHSSENSWLGITLTKLIELIVRSSARWKIIRIEVWEQFVFLLFNFSFVVDGK